MVLSVLNQLLNTILLFDAAGNESASVFPESNEEFVVSGPEPLWKTIGKWALLGVLAGVTAYLYWKEAGGSIVSDAVVVAPSVAASVGTSVAASVGTSVAAGVGTSVAAGVATSVAAGVATIFGHTVDTVAVVQAPTLHVSRKICIVVSVAILKSLNESQLLLDLAYYTSLNETGLAMTSHSVAQSISIPIFKVVPPVLTPIIEAVVNTAPTFTGADEDTIRGFMRLLLKYQEPGLSEEIKVHMYLKVCDLNPSETVLFNEAAMRLARDDNLKF